MIKAISPKEAFTKNKNNKTTKETSKWKKEDIILRINRGLIANCDLVNKLNNKTMFMEVHQFLLISGGFSSTSTPQACFRRICSHLKENNYYNDILEMYNKIGWRMVWDFDDKEYKVYLKISLKDNKIKPEEINRFQIMDLE